MLNAPDAKSIELTIGDEVLRLAIGHPETLDVEASARAIDFRTGVLHSS